MLNKRDNEFLKHGLILLKYNIHIKKNKFRLTLVALHPLDVKRTTIKTAMKEILKTMLIFRFFSKGARTVYKNSQLDFNDFTANNKTYKATTMNEVRLL